MQPRNLLETYPNSKYLVLFLFAACLSLVAMMNTEEELDELQAIEREEITYLERPSVMVSKKKKVCDTTKARIGGGVNLGGVEVCQDFLNGKLGQIKQRFDFPLPTDTYNDNAGRFFVSHTSKMLFYYIPNRSGENILDAMNSQLELAMKEDGVTPLGLTADEASDLIREQGYFVFTFVTDPMEHFIDGFEDAFDTASFANFRSYLDVVLGEFKLPPAAPKTVITPTPAKGDDPSAPVTDNMEEGVHDDNLDPEYHGQMIGINDTSAAGGDAGAGRRLVEDTLAANSPETITCALCKPKAMPQMYWINKAVHRDGFPIRFNYIGRYTMANAFDDWHLMNVAAHQFGIPESKLFERGVRASEAVFVKNSEVVEGLAQNDFVMRALCQLRWEDYTCFDLELPEICTNNYNQYEAGMTVEY